MPWRLVPERSQGAEKLFELSANEHTLALWPFQFKAFLTVNLLPNSLQISLSVENQGPQSLSFTGALHTYLAVDHIAQVSLQGQANQPEWDAVKDTHQTCADQLRFEAEFDRVYDANTRMQPTWTLQDGTASLQISQSPSWGQSVVWNPGADKCAQLNDMPAKGYQRMLCVEAARVTSSIEVPPTQTWVGWQLLKI